MRTKMSALRKASSSSVLGEIERERESPTPISGDGMVEVISTFR